MEVLFKVSPELGNTWRGEGEIHLLIWQNRQAFFVVAIDQKSYKQWSSPTTSCFHFQVFTT
jgi:hypothetical protein